MRKNYADLRAAVHGLGDQSSCQSERVKLPEELIVEAPVRCFHGVMDHLLTQLLDFSERALLRLPDFQINQFLGTNILKYVIQITSKRKHKDSKP